MTADQNFSVVTGGGGPNDPPTDSTSFTVSINARTGSYGVAASLAGVHDIFGIDITSQTSTSFIAQLTSPLRVGDTIAFHVYDIDNTSLPPGSVLLNVQVLSGSTTAYTPTTGTNSIWVRMVGGGGGGGGAGGGVGSGSAAGGGGSSGTYGETWVTGVPILGGAGSVTIGAGGAGGAAGVNGHAGTLTKLVVNGTLTVTVNGGRGGSAMSLNTAAVITTAASASINAGSNTDVIMGTPGGSGLLLSTTSGVSGAGGSSPLGGGGASKVVAAPSAGEDAVGFGGGGSGGTAHAGGNAGGAGSPGVIIVHEFA